MEEKTKNRIRFITEKLANQNIFDSVGSSLAVSVSEEEFSKTMKESEVGLSSLFGNNTYNAISNYKKDNIKRLTLEQITLLTNELIDLIKENQK
jgi:hypothetical protein